MKSSRQVCTMASSVNESTTQTRTFQNGEWKTVTTRTVITTEGGRTSKQVFTTEETSSGGSLPTEFNRKCALEDGFRTTSTKAPEQSGLFSRLKERSAAKDGASNAAPARQQSSDEFAKDCLVAHNKYRAKHGVAAVKLNKMICAYSQEWADKLAREGKFQHRQDHKYGENIFMKWSSNPNERISGAEAVDSWYSEIKDHVFGQEPRSLASGHFTQVVWKGCKEMGAGMARSGDGKILVVANYDPPGNMMGSFAANVPRPI